GSVLRSAAPVKIAVIGAVLLAVGLVAGVGLLAGRPPAAAEESKPPASAPPEKEPALPAVGEKKMTVTRRGLGAHDRPAAGARVGLVVGPYAHRQGQAQMGGPVLLGQTTSDKEGRFRLTAPATSSAQHYLVKIFATAAGRGLGQEMLDPNLAAQDVPVRLSA